MPERVLIAGSREFPALHLVRCYMVEVFSAGGTLIHGGARGVDRTAANYAKALEIEVESYPADWEKHGKAAGFTRNEQMVERADRVAAFWDGESRGTRHTIKLAMDVGLPLDLFIRYK